MSVVTVPSWVPLRALAVVAAAVVSLAVVRRLSPDEGARVRTKLLHGVPWGTLLTVALVASVYLFVQGGLDHPRRPLVVPFRSWSYFYPLGMLTAAFSHGSWSHLVGNLTATLAFATVAEYAWGHYPRGRGIQTFTSLRSNPYARILAVPAASVVVGLFTAAFALGPVVGFSGVVFAYAGFALVQRPVLALLALLGARVVNLGLSALVNPRVTTSLEPRVVRPWWADIAIQGHGIGVLAGVLLGLWLATCRDDWPDPRRLWFAVVAFAAFQGLWALYVPGDDGRYVLFRWLGVLVVFLLTALVVASATRSRGALVRPFDVSRRGVATAALVVVLAALSVAAVPYNVAPIDQQPAPEPSVQVRDYSVGYAENVENGYVGAVSVPFVDETPTVNASGVIVTSERRYVWRPAIPRTTLQHRGRTSVLLGGIGWRERVYANWTGWTLAGGENAYHVFLNPAGEQRTRVFSSQPARADPTIAGRNVSLRPVDDRFEFVVTRDNATVGSVPVPDDGDAAAAGGLTFRRNASTVYAVENRTRIAIATRDGN